MGDLRRTVGFWGSLGRLRVRDLLTVEIAGGTLLATVMSVLVVRLVPVTARVEIAGDFLQVAGALLGIVFAALALVVALISEDYLRRLNDVRDGVLAFLSPFMIAIGFLVAAVLATVGYRALAEDLPTAVEPWIFGAVATLFVVGTLEIVALARSVLMHGVARARLLQVTDLQAERERKKLGGA